MKNLKEICLVLALLVMSATAHAKDKQELTVFPVTHSEYTRTHSITFRAHTNSDCSGSASGTTTGSVNDGQVNLNSQASGSVSCSSYYVPARTWTHESDFYQQIVRDGAGNVYTFKAEKWGYFEKPSYKAERDGNHMTIFYHDDVDNKDKKHKFTIEAVELAPGGAK
jgi:hypothetical protein